MLNLKGQTQYNEMLKYPGVSKSDCDRDVNQQDEKHDEAERQVHNMPVVENLFHLFKVRDSPRKDDALLNHVPHFSSDTVKSIVLSHFVIDALEFQSSGNAADSEETEDLQGRHSRHRNRSTRYRINFVDELSVELKFQFQHSPDPAILFFQLVHRQFVPVNAARDLDVHISSKDAAQHDCGHAPETHRDQPAELERGMIEHQDRPHKAKEHVEFEMTFDLPEIGEGMNSFARRVDHNPRGNHQRTNDAVPVPQRSAGLQLVVLCVEGSLTQGRQIIITPTDGEDNRCESSSENQNSYVENVSGVLHGDQER